MIAKRQKAAEPAPAKEADVVELTPDWQADFVARVRLEKARIPKRFLEKTLDSFKPARGSKRKDVLAAARSFVQSFNFKDGVPRGLLIRGIVGCGKTHVAVAILKEVIAKGYTGLYYNMVDLLSDIRATYDNRSPLSESELLEELNEPDLLVLDDLGAEKSAEWVNDRLYLIVNRRYESARPILVTTNLTEEELTKKLGERIVSRLREICEGLPPFPDEDYRRAHMS